MWVALLWLVLAGCGPVMLGEEQAAPLGGSGSADAPIAGSDAEPPDMGGSGEPDPMAPRPSVVVHLLPLDCGRCFDLFAEGSGGLPPYTFRWEDGSLQSQRRVCVENAGTVLRITARDATNTESETHTIRLARVEDGGCPDDAQGDASVAAELCLENPSFEGTPIANLGNPGEFDAEPWSACTNPVVANTPDIGNPAVSVGTTVPPPVDGETYIALGEGEQVSQTLCSEVPLGAELSFEVDLARIDVGDVPLAENVFLEAWGGLSVDCSQRQLLWASPALNTGWKRFCVTLRPQFFMNRLTFRSNSDMTSIGLSYLIMDNLQPVDSCP